MFSAFAAVVTSAANAVVDAIIDPEELILTESGLAKIATLRSEIGRITQTPELKASSTQREMILAFLNEIANTTAGELYTLSKTKTFDPEQRLQAQMLLVNKKISTLYGYGIPDVFDQQSYQVAQAILKFLASFNLEMDADIPVVIAASLDPQKRLDNFCQALKCVCSIYEQLRTSQTAQDLIAGYEKEILALRSSASFDGLGDEEKIMAFNQALAPLIKKVLTSNIPWWLPESSAQFNSPVLLQFGSIAPGKIKLVNLLWDAENEFYNTLTGPTIPANRLVPAALLTIEAEKEGAVKKAEDTYCAQIASFKEAVETYKQSGGTLSWLAGIAKTPEKLEILTKLVDQLECTSPDAFSGAQVGHALKLAIEAFTEHEQLIRELQIDRSNCGTVLMNFIESLMTSFKSLSVACDPGLMEKLQAYEGGLGAQKRRSLSM